EPQEDGRGEILEPFLCGLLEDRCENPLSRYGRSLSRRRDQGDLPQGAPSTRTAGPQSMAVIPPLDIAALDALPLDPSTKGLPFGLPPMRLGEVAARNWDIL